ncbi:MAG: peptidylprolyl isomerase [Flavobacteriaceae bacterium]|nr:peptidylprolyl isomerase [Flavobacteriaceae bacterium]
MKNLNTIFLFLFPFFALAQQGYEIIPDEVKKTPEEVLSQGGRIKVDGVAAVVGNYVILESDVDKTLIDLKQNGYSTASRCEIIGKLLEDKLYAHQATQDSIIVTDSEINSMVDQQIARFAEQLGSIDKVVQFYQKSSVEELRQELFDIDKSQKLAQDMQEKIIESIEVTPDEVRQFFNNISKDQKPFFGAEVELAQIVIKPQVTEKAKQAVIDRLNEIRYDVVENGASFSSKAILYSQDPGSSSKGGLYIINKQTPFVKEFKDVAFTLQEGEVSQPFESEFGWHIIQLDKIRGKDRELRHILISPEVTSTDLAKAKVAIDSVRQKISSGEISFEDAALIFSSEKETRANGGKLFNPQTLETRLELTKLDPSMYEKVSALKEGEISLPFLESKGRAEEKNYKIIKVLRRWDEHEADFVKDYSRIKELALRDKQIREIGKWQEEKIKDTYISISGSYKSCEFTNNWLKK